VDRRVAGRHAVRDSRVRQRSCVARDASPRRVRLCDRRTGPVIDRVDCGPSSGARVAFARPPFRAYVAGSVLAHARGCVVPCTRREPSRASERGESHGVIPSATDLRAMCRERRRRNAAAPCSFARRMCWPTRSVLSLGRSVGISRRPLARRAGSTRRRRSSPPVARACA
jgi:hypothetical protein